MKKITLALCACAFALTALFISCKNSVDYKNVSSYSSNYKYAVKGTMVTTSENSMKTDSDGNTPNANGKITSNKTEVTTTIDNGFVAVGSNTDENRESNYTDYSLSGNYTGTERTVSTNVLYGDANQTSTDNSKTDSFSLSMNFLEIDGDLYIKEGNKVTKIETLAISEDDDAFEGDFGDDFALNVKITETYSTVEDIYKYMLEEMDDSNSYSGDFKDTSVYDYIKAWVDAGMVITETKEMKLKFVLVEDFDPTEEDD